MEYRLPPVARDQSDRFFSIPLHRQVRNGVETFKGKLDVIFAYSPLGADHEPFLKDIFSDGFCHLCTRIVDIDTPIEEYKRFTSVLGFKDRTLEARSTAFNASSIADAHGYSLWFDTFQIFQHGPEKKSENEKDVWIALTIDAQQLTHAFLSRENLTDERVYADPAFRLSVFNKDMTKFCYFVDIPAYKNMP